MNEKAVEEKESSDKGKIGNLMRDILLGGMATVFMTEDAVKSSIKDMKLPKEFVTALLEGLSKKKDDLTQVFSSEIAKVFSKIDFSKELTRFLENHHVSIDAKITFAPKKNEKL